MDPEKLPYDQELNIYIKRADVVLAFRGSVFKEEGGGGEKS